MIKLILNSNNKKISTIAEKAINSEMISDDDCVFLYNQANISELAIISDYIRLSKVGKDVFYNKNFHIEPTNICKYNCKFCSYSRKKGDPGSWDYSIEQMTEMAIKESKKGITEIHIVGGVHPDRDFNYYLEILKSIKIALPKIHLKAYSAIELDFMIKSSGYNLRDALILLKNAGLDSIPGGGAEIFNKEIRNKICPDKPDGGRWLEIHEELHKIGLKSNATMLYGHFESYEHRVEHMSKIRALQNKTNGFMSFIPLKFKSKNNSLGIKKEVSLLEDLRNFAVSRIYLSNFDHIKAYWPMLGKQNAQISMAFGVNDIDGTIEDSTKIYSMAGAEDASPSMSVKEIVQLISSAGYNPVERDSLYRKIN